jgi:hypothetical protein
MPMVSSLVDMASALIMSEVYINHSNEQNFVI